MDVLDFSSHFSDTINYQDYQLSIDNYQLSIIKITVTFLFTYLLLQNILVLDFLVLNHLTLLR